jgi:UDP-glucuronate 4-epimerase
MKILITGVAGFIGFHTARRFLAQGNDVVGIDNLNDYYDVSLKEARLMRLQELNAFRFERIDITDTEAVTTLFGRERFDRVVHLAAQAGVRHSLKDPQSYIASNIKGTLSVLEGCRYSNVGHLVYASSSSVYGASTQMPFSEHEAASHPLSIYAASKRSAELMAHSYSSLFDLPVTGLRFFTVYGPWGRPDMALFLFTRAILEGTPIEIFNSGNHQRDFTYIDDIVEGIYRVTNHIARPNGQWDPNQPDPATSYAPYRLYNIGSNRPVPLTHYIDILEDCLGRKATRIFKPMQLGDVQNTFADVSELINNVAYKPETPVEIGIRNFVNWFREYYGYN